MAAVFGVGALISYQQGREEKERKERAALNQRAAPVAVPTTPGASPSGTFGAPSPSPTRSPRREPVAAPPRTSAAPQAKTKRAAESRFPTGPNFSTTTNVLVRTVMTGLCADLPGPGMGTEQGPVEQSTCDGSAKDNQRWDSVVNQKGAGPGGADLFSIRIPRAPTAWTSGGPIHPRWGPS
ncbi:hypothetical protein GCM10010182_38230 [Actinomadura cremea]|nr:hypothetical protein GCM10010182_38230 [Actinomadura cremea]